MNENRGADGQKPIKIGRVSNPSMSSEINFESTDGSRRTLTAIEQDPSEPLTSLATMHSFDPETGTAESSHGKLKGVIVESGKFVWEHKGKASAAASVVVSVTIGTLWVLHKRKN